MERFSSSTCRFEQIAITYIATLDLVFFLEIEALLLTHPKIKDCGVIGKPDELAGELPMAFVVRLHPSLSEKEVINFVNEKASPAKKLRGGVIFVDEIPKSPSGKILRRGLRDQLQKAVLKSKL